MKKHYRSILYFVAILFGAFLFVYGEFDDSPGGQLLGLIMVIIGIVGLIRRKKNS
jgi:LPXTG-motif cell wall-anchored protein